MGWYMQEGTVIMVMLWFPGVLFLKYKAYNTEINQAIYDQIWNYGALQVAA
jgi:hypothetical protein